MKTYWGGGTEPRILDLGTVRKWRPDRFNSRENSPRYSLDRRFNSKVGS